MWDASFRLRGHSELHGHSGNERVVSSIIREVDKKRRQMASGFLLDNQQWQALHEAMANDRFATAVLSGFFSPTTLARLPKDDFPYLVRILNLLGIDEFVDVLKGRAQPGSMGARVTTHISGFKD